MRTVCNTAIVLQLERSSIRPRPGERGRSSIAACRSGQPWWSDVMSRVHLVVTAVTIAAVSLGASAAMDTSKRMADGKQWTTQNLSVNVVPSYCYEDADPNCRKYG